jgi:molybdate transport system regulatory protein
MKKTTAASLTGPSLASAFSHEPADKRIEILRLVGESGSISQAARQAKVSYKAAWQAIDTLTNLAGVALVERAVGGSGGGGATLTPAGQKLLAVAGLLNETRGQVLAAFKSNELLLPRALPTLSTMSVRTSMRNQLPCEVGKLEIRGQVARVHLKLAGGAGLVSRITKASAELLGLQKEQAVLLCKATAVAVSAREATATGAQNLDGHAVRISRGASGDEVSLQLEGGLQLVGFAAPGSGLKIKSPVQARIDESAVVIALAS